MDQLLGSLHGTTLALCICMTVVWLGLLVELQAVGAGSVPNTLPGFGKPVPNAGLPCQALFKDSSLVLPA